MLLNREFCFRLLEVCLPFWKGKLSLVFQKVKLGNEMQFIPKIIPSNTLLYKVTNGAICQDFQTRFHQFSSLVYCIFTSSMSLLHYLLQGIPYGWDDFQKATILWLRFWCQIFLWGKGKVVCIPNMKLFYNLSYPYGDTL